MNIGILCIKMVIEGNRAAILRESGILRRILAQSGKQVNMEPRGASRSSSGESVPRASVLWGPMSPEASRRAGAAFPTSSALLRPKLPRGVAEAATAVVPDEVLARPDDTATTVDSSLIAYHEAYQATSQHATKHATDVEQSFGHFKCGCALAKARGDASCLDCFSKGQLHAIHQETYGLPGAPHAALDRQPIDHHNDGLAVRNDSSR